MHNNTDSTDETTTSLDQGLTADQQHRGMRSIYGAASMIALHITFVSGSAVMVLFIKALGGSDFQAMLPAALIFLLRLVQLPVSMKVPPRMGKRFITNCWTVSIIILLIAYLLPFVTGPGQSTIITFLILFSVAVAIRACGGVFWFPLLHDLVPVNIRGRFFGKMRSLWNTVAVLAVLASGAFLGKNPDIWQFQVIFIVSIFLFAGAIIIIRKIPTGSSLSGELDFDDWRLYIKDLLRQRALLIFLAYYGVLGFFMGVLGQPLVLYMKHRGFAASNNIFIFCFTNFGTIASLFVAGLFVDKIGTKRVFLATHLVLCLICFFVVLTGAMSKEATMFLLPVAMLFSGAMIAASGVACTAQMFHLIPNRGRAFFMSFAWVVIFLGRAISPMCVGGILNWTGEDWTCSLLNYQLGIFQVILGVTGVMMLAAVGLVFFIQEVKPIQATKTK